MSALPPLGSGNYYVGNCLLLYTNSLCRPGLESHLVGLLDLRLQSHSTCRGVDDVDHLRKQFRSIGVPGVVRELDGPAQFGRCSIDIARLAQIEPLLDGLRQFGL